MKISFADQIHNTLTVIADFKLAPDTKVELTTLTTRIIKGDDTTTFYTFAILDVVATSEALFSLNAIFQETLLLADKLHMSESDVAKLINHLCSKINDTIKVNNINLN